MSAGQQPGGGRPAQHTSPWARAAAAKGVSVATYLQHHGGGGGQGGGKGAYHAGQIAAHAQAQADKLLAHQGRNWSGLGGVVDLLSKGGITQEQVDNMTKGYNGTDASGGAVGGGGGKFAGLSPYAMHFLATSGLLQEQAPNLMSLKDASGVDLAGDELFKAQLMNKQLSAMPKTYKLHSGIDVNSLNQLLGTLGHPAYQNGFDMGGLVNRSLMGQRSGAVGNGTQWQPGAFTH